jgi:hypothetical protein
VIRALSSAVLLSKVAAASAALCSDFPISSRILKLDGFS